MRFLGSRGIAVLASCVLMVGVAPAVASGAGSFGIEPGSFSITPSTFQAGAHENLTTTFNFTHEGSLKETNGDAKTTTVELPAGFTGNATAIPTCPQSDLIGPGSVSNCPLDTQIGTIIFTTNAIGVAIPFTLPLYNMETTSPGIVSEFAFDLSGIITQVFPITVRPNDSGLTITSPEIVGLGELSEVSVTVWGVPASHEHDAMRGKECFLGNCPPGEQSVDIPLKPYLSNPTNCTTPLVAKLRSNSWQHPDQYTEASYEIPHMVECERVPFNPAITVEPTTTNAESPSGLDVSLNVPQAWENAYDIATSNMEAAKVTLPEGYTVNPSAGAGLVGCTPAEYAAETAASAPGAGCPLESKLGTVAIETPVLGEPIDGNVYLASPYDNPFGEPGHPGGSLLALYVVAKDRLRGIVVKTAGKVVPNPVTGQLTSTFEDTPQQPFSHFSLKFTQGTTSPLVSPPLCGSYTTLSELTPWSALSEPRLLSASLSITKGIGGGACPAGGVPPFKPTVISGTEDNDAGSYSAFYLRIVREDGEQELTKFSTTLPPGLTGNLTGIPFCSEADIEAARSVSGAEEEVNPSCPAASEIGHTTVEAGVGSVLAQAPGKVYLAGRYHGSPLSVVSITSAKVGPFDLGTVVIRFALDINPITAQVEVSGAQSDPIPHIIDGVVVHVRDIRVYMNRPNFTVNSTNCSPLSITDAITGAGANPANLANQDTVNVSTPFEAADCASLHFKPAFKVTTSGKTSRADGASLSVALMMAGAQGTNSNIKAVKVDLPKQLPSRLTTLQKACTSAQFEANPAGCPAASIVGHAKAVTPVLPVPLEGPAYFVSYGGAKFPELVIVLQGYGFTIDLHGETFISKEGITSSTFRSVPDQPVSSFELTLPQGPNSALAANGNFCALTKTVLVKRKTKVRRKGRTRTVTRTVRKTVAGSLVMPTAFTAQNGMVIHQNTPIEVTGCGKTRKAKASRRGTRRKRK